MKLQVTEKIDNSLNNFSAENVTEYEFKKGKTFGKLNYGTIFQAQVNNSDKSVEVSLIRQINEDDFEVYNKKTIYASKQQSFQQETTTNDKISITFKLIK